VIEEYKKTPKASVWMKLKGVEEDREEDVRQTAQRRADSLGPGNARSARRVTAVADAF